MELDPYNAFVARTDERPAPGAWRVAVKDMISVREMPQLAGISARRDCVASADAPVVARLRERGHAIVGVTRSDAAGFGTMTDEVTNPTHPTRAVGGSSGGSAAAVAGGLADIALGTDTGGSVRIPAAYCGLCAFKPSRGRVPLEGVLPLSPTLDHVGVMAADPQTLAHAAVALLGTDRATAPAPQAAPKIGASEEALAASDPDIAAAFSRLAERLDATPLAPPYDDQRLAAASSDVICAEALEVHRERFSADPAGFPPLARGGLEYGETLSPDALEAARATVAEAGERWRNALGPLDCLISPTLPMAPADRHAITARVRGADWPITNANIRLCQFANAAGVPVVVAPVGGLSVQFIGRFGEDEALIATALALLAHLDETA